VQLTWRTGDARLVALRDREARQMRPYRRTLRELPTATTALLQSLDLAPAMPSWLCLALAAVESSEPKRINVHKITVQRYLEAGTQNAMSNAIVLVTGVDWCNGSHLTEALLRDGVEARAFVMYNV
jgi:hypothetical protein